MDTTKLVDYLEELKANNEKPWFDANRRRYEALRSEFQSLVGTLIKSIGSFDKELADLTPAGAMFRINRDIRFSKDKSPYKTSFSAMFVQGKKSVDHPAGYYFHINAEDELFVAAGIYMPSPPVLAKVRKAIAQDHSRLTSILDAPAVKDAFGGLEGEKLKTMPRDYSADHPAAEYLKYKGFILVSTEQATKSSGDALAAHIADRFRLTYPFVTFLREATA
jgi:uncharacterized protein (TIGR02453 family)